MTIVVTLPSTLEWLFEILFGTVIFRYIILHWVSDEIRIHIFDPFGRLMLRIMKWLFKVSEDEMKLYASHREATRRTGKLKQD